MARRDSGSDADAPRPALHPAESPAASTVDSVGNGNRPESE
jgi:hypothetical protein